MSNVLMLNGPNLNMLGQRQPEIYGRETLEDVERDCGNLAAELGLTFRAEQSNHEGVLIDLIQGARGHQHAIVINAGAYTHTSIAIHDALNLYDGAVVEVHISNIHCRETFRHHSFISARADAVIVGCGTHGYQLALHHVAQLVGKG